MKLIAIQRDDGQVSIMTHIAGEVAEAIAKWEESGFKAVSWKEITDVPADRSFRAGWVLGEVVGHDMGKCRAIHKDKLREMRSPKLAALDVAYMRALEAGDTAAMQSISAEKQILRDVTGDPEINAAQTTDELKNVIPNCLK